MTKPDSESKCEDREQTRRMISIVVPVYNEIESVTELHRQISDVMSKIEHDYEIVFVNDGCTDGSAERLDEIATEDSRTKVIHFKANFGQTAAIGAGFQYSVGDTVIAMDADLQNDPKDIPNLLAKLDEGYDVVSGWRKKRKDKFLTRRLPSMVANWMVSRMLGVPLHDYGCSLKVYRRSSLEGIHLYGEMHRFIPVYVAWQGGRVTELPVNHRPRLHGRSKYGLSRVPRVALDLILMRFMDTALDRPIQFFGMVGIYCFGLAGLVAIWALYLKYVEGLYFIQTPLPLLVALLILSAFMFVLLGIISEIQIRTYFETLGKSPYQIKRTTNFELAHHTPNDKQA